MEIFAAVVKFFSLDLVGFKLIVQVSTESQVDEFARDENNRQLDLKSCALGLEIIAQAFKDYSRVIPNNALEDGRSLANICLEITSEVNYNDYGTESKEVVDELKERLEHSAKSILSLSNHLLKKNEGYRSGQTHLNSRRPAIQKFQQTLSMMVKWLKFLPSEHFKNKMRLPWGYKYSHKTEKESKESLDDLIEMVDRELTSESEYSRYEQELYEKVKASLEKNRLSL